MFSSSLSSLSAGGRANVFEQPKSARLPVKIRGRVTLQPAYFDCKQNLGRAFAPESLGKSAALLASRPWLGRRPEQDQNEKPPHWRTIPFWFNSVHVDDKERVGQAFESLIKEGEPYDIECRARKKNGEWFWAHDRAVATRDSNGLRVAIGLISDISVRKAGEESEGHYRSLFENMLEGFARCEMVFDDRGRPIDFVYLAVNSTFEKLTGLRNVVGRRFTEIIPS
jgi:PAS domain-containing protein